MEALRTDERAIEGLPIRLVIAVAVGVAALGIMLGMLAEFDDFGTTEVTVEASDELLVPDDGSYETVTLAVVTEDGQPVEDAQLLVTEGSLPLANGPVDLQTGPDSHEATLAIGSSSPDADAHAALDFREGQSRGTIEVEIVPPSGTDLRDERDNPELVVVDG
jgi:hypothetical protein